MQDFVQKSILHVEEEQDEECLPRWCVKKYGLLRRSRKALFPIHNCRVFIIRFDDEISHRWCDRGIHWVERFSRII